MRSNGVTDFPDPQPGGGFVFKADPAMMSSPGYAAAQAKCAKYTPSPVGPSSGNNNESPQVKAHALAQLRRVALCMRKHGITDFPDPSLTAPADLSPGKYEEITNYEGVFLDFPASLDMHSPAWNRAAAACGSLAESFNHSHH